MNEPTTWERLQSVDRETMLRALGSVLDLADAIIIESPIAPQYGRDIKWAIKSALDSKD